MGCKLKITKCNPKIPYTRFVPTGDDSGCINLQVCELFLVYNSIFSLQPDFWLTGTFITFSGAPSEMVTECTTVSPIHQQTLPVRSGIWIIFSLQRLFLAYKWILAYKENFKQSPWLAHLLGLLQCWSTPPEAPLSRVVASMRVVCVCYFYLTHCFSVYKHLWSTKKIKS